MAQAVGAGPDAGVSGPVGGKRTRRRQTPPFSGSPRSVLCRGRPPTVSELRPAEAHDAIAAVISKSVDGAEGLV